MTSFREMRLPRQALSGEETLEILKANDVGVLATVNEEGNPRARAVNYSVLDENTLIFHGSKVGEKMDNMHHNPNVSFFVIDQSEIVKGKFDTNYRSVSVHGQAEILEGDAAFPYLVSLTKAIDNGVSDQEIHDYTYPHRIGKMVVVLIHIEHMTGKAGGPQMS